MIVWDGSHKRQGKKKCLVVVSGWMLRISERQAAGQGCVNQDAHSRSGETFFFLVVALAPLPSRLGPILFSTLHPGQPMIINSQLPAFSGVR